MAQGENLGASFSIDITQLKAGLAQANRLIRESNSEFKAAAAGMDDWSNSQEGLEAKIKNLNTVADLQSKKIDALKSEYDRLVSEGMDPASAKAIQLRTQINQESEALEKSKKDIDKYNAALAEMSGQSSETVSASQRLRNEISKQEKDLAKLQEEYSDTVLEQGKNSRAAKDLKKKIAELTRSLSENEKKLDDSSSGLKNVEKAAKKAGDGFTIAKGAIATFIGNGLTSLVGACKNAISKVMGLSESTMETRENFAKLETSFNSAGLGVKNATKTYEELYGVLGDTGRATEASQQLAKISKDEKDLAANTRILTGVMAEYGDSIPLEGLAEGIAASSAMSNVQGVLADALEWQGINLDEFNEQLASLATEEERSAFIQETLTGLYGESADAYEENNKSIIEARKANLEYQKSMDTLGAKLEPVTTSIKLGFARILDKVVELVEGVDLEAFAEKISSAFDGFINDVLPKIINAIQWIIDHKELIAGIAIAIGVVAAAIGVLNTVLAIQSAIMMANPVTWIVLGIVAAIAALIAIIVVCIKHWDQIKEAGQKAWQGIKDAFSSAGKWFNEKVIQPVSKFFSGLWDGFKTGAKNAWEGVKSVFGKVADFFGNIFSKAWQKVKDVFSVGGKIFDGIKDGIISGFKTVVNAIIRGINKVVAVPFAGLNKVLDTISGVSIAGLKPFNWLTWRAKAPVIPELATGGIVNRATNAIIGEDGREAVLPLEKNTAWMDMLAEKLASKQGKVVVNQTNNYSQAHSRYEIYKSKQQTAAAVRLALQKG